MLFKNPSNFKKTTRFFIFKKNRPVIVSRRKLVYHESGQIGLRATEITGLFCCHCKKYKKIDKFYFIKYKNIYRFRSWCKKCYKKINNKRALNWYYKNKLRALNRIKKWQSDDKENRVYKYMPFYFLNGNRKLIFKRDNNMCQNCGSKDKLIIHHKDMKGRNCKDRKLNFNNDTNNLVVLCQHCHCIIHNGRQENLKNLINPNLLWF